MTNLNQLNEALDSALQTNQAMGKKLHQQQELIEVFVGKLQAIKDHQSGLIKGMPHLSTTFYIADKALQSAKEAGYDIKSD